MVRNNFLFLKNIESRDITISIFDDFNSNFIFFKKLDKNLFKNIKFISLKKINSNQQCINVLYF